MSDFPKICVWGPIGSGKTAYLAALYLELQKEWNVIDQSSVGKDTGRLMQRIAVSLTKGDFPDATVPQEGALHYAFFCHPNSQNFTNKLQQRRFGISLIEAAGESMCNDSSLIDDIGNRRKYFEDISEADGIIAMIDPASEQKTNRQLFGDESCNYYLALQKLFSHLQTGENGKVSPKIAFCVTKTDIDEYAVSLNMMKVEDIARRIVGRDASNLINSRCVIGRFNSRVKFFASSVPGRYIINDGITERPNVYFAPKRNNYQIQKPNERTPYGIIEPLKWILGKYL